MPYYTSFFIKKIVYSLNKEKLSKNDFNYKVCPWYATELCIINVPVTCFETSYVIQRVHDA